MANKRNERKKYPNSSQGGQDITRPPRNVAVKIPQPLTVRQESTADDNQRHREERDQRDASLRAAQRLNKITIGGAVLSLAGLLAVYLTYWQSRNAFQLGQRAWVMVSVFSIDEPISTGKWVQVHFKIKNFGNSPAKHVTSRTQVSWDGICTPMETPHPQYFTDSPIAPGQFDDYPNDGFITNSQECIDAMNDGTAHLKVFGIIEYFDIFDRKRTTHFCEQYEAKASGTMTACPTGNDIE